MRKRLISLAAACIIGFSALPVNAADSYPFVAYAQDRLNIRSSASQVGTVVATMNAGDAAVVSGMIGEYYIVIYEGKRGYVLKSGLSEETVVVAESDETIPEDYTIVKNGDRGRAVRALQEALQELGYYTGTISGYFDTALFNAVISFQMKNGLTGSGIADVATQKKLYEETVSSANGKKSKVSVLPPIASVELKSGKRGDAVRELQQRLTELRYYTGEISGVYDTATTKAVRDFQTANRLTVDGKAGTKTLTKLYSDAVVLGKKATAAPTLPATAKPTEVPTKTGSEETSVYPYTSVTLASVNLRQKADTSSTRLLTIPKGATIQVLAQSGDFLKVTYQNKTGFVMGKYVNIPVQSLANAQEEDGVYKSLSIGAAGSEVMALQNALVELGYLSSADGTFGTSTKAAVAAFQTKNKLPSTGIADSATQRLIFEGKPKNAKGNSTTVNALPAIENVEMKLNNYGEAVFSLKTMLKDLGYYTGEVNETFDKTLQTAVKTFQRVNKMTVDGIAGEKTQKAILQAYQAKHPQVSSAPTETPTPAPNATAAPVSMQPTPVTGDNVIVLREGMEGEAVVTVQKKLIELGYLPNDLEPDGKYDTDEVQAVMRFQAMNHLTVDGIAGIATQNIMFSVIAIPATGTPTPIPTATPGPTAIPTQIPYARVTLKKGSSGEEVKALQDRLISLGYLSDSVDGEFGLSTERAVKAFQKANGITMDGVVGLATLAAIYSPTAKSVVTAAPKATANTAAVKTTATPRTTGAQKTTVTPKATATPKPTATPRPTATAKPTATPRSTATARVKTTATPLRTVPPYLVTGAPPATQTPRTVSTPRTVTTATPRPSTTAKTLTGTRATATPRVTATPKATSTPKTPSVLQRGNKGNDVTLLQQRLIALGYLKGTADGIFGSSTQKAVIAFQTANGLKGDGIAGSKTLQAIYASNAKAASTPSPMPNARITPTPVAATPTPMPTPASVTPAPAVTAVAAVTVPTADQVKNVNWYTDIRAKAKAMPDVTVYDPVTGISYHLHMFSFGKHADAEPPTAVDTALMYQVIGTNSWTPHAVWVIFQDGTVYLASTHSHGHMVDHTAGNNLDGHICVHFPRVMSEAEDTGPYAVSHQKAIIAEWERIQNLLKQTAKQ